MPSVTVIATLCRLEIGDPAGWKPALRSNARTLSTARSFSLQDPLVRLQPLQSANDAVANRQLRFPAGRLNLGRIEKNERIVSNPTSVPSAVLQPRFQPKVSADPAD